MTPRKVANLELLLTQDKAPRHKAVDDFEEDSWSRRMRYLKARAWAWWLVACGVGGWVGWSVGLLVGGWVGRQGDGH